MSMFDKINQRRSVEEPGAFGDAQLDVEELNLVTKAMWEILKSKFGITESELKHQISKLKQADSGNETLIIEPSELSEQTPEIVEQETEVVEEVEPAPEVVEPTTVVAEEVPETVEPVSATPEPKEKAHQVIEDRPPEVENVFKAIEHRTIEKVEISIEPEESEKEPIKVKLRGDLVKCPGCRKVFSVLDSRLWDGHQHTPCGTPLDVEGLSSLVFEKKKS